MLHPRVTCISELRSTSSDLSYRSIPPICIHLRDTSRVPHLYDPPLLCFRFSDPTTPRYVFPFVFPLRALLHITLLVIPCPSFCDAHVFPSTHIRYSRTSVRPLQTFLIRPQYLLDLDSPLFPFRTDFKLYK